MEQIGYSLIDSAGTELKSWGDISGQASGIPDFILWPNGDQTYCPTVGMEHGGAKLVSRMLDQKTGPSASDTVSYDGINIIVTRVIVAERPLITKAAIIDRLQSVGKLEAARSALNAADLYTQERWNARDAIYADDPTALALLQKIGADPSVILAP